MRTDPTKQRVDLIGTTYRADWIATSSSGYTTQLTQKLTLPPGTYVLAWSVPTSSNSGYMAGLNYRDDKWAGVGSYCSRACVVTLTQQTEVWLIPGTRASTTFSDLAYGGIDAIRIA